MVIMAARIAYMLKRIGCPCLDADLRMFYTADNAELDISLVTLYTIHETCIRAVKRATQGITYIVTERSNPVKHIGIVLKCDLFGRICRSHRSPSLAIYHYIRINRMQTLAYFIHRIDIVDGHEVETETVDMIFLHPPLERLDHIFTEHLLLRSGLIAAARSVTERTILIHAVEIPRHGTFETCLRGVCRMVIYNIKNNAETGFMKGLNHLLEFLDTGCRIIRIC